MRRSQILWIDLRDNKDKCCVSNRLFANYKIQVISNAAEIPEAIQLRQPHILCFDYDYPDQADIQILQQSKSLYPALPFVMLTADHSAELVLWALRTRVWNYYIKPVSTDCLIDSIEVLLKPHSNNRLHKRNNLMPQPVIPTEIRLNRKKVNRTSTANAASYVRRHLDEKITLEDVANLCRMSKYHFSRTFRYDHRISFQEFLIQQRIEKAVNLLKESDLDVTQIALAVGYTDASYFSKSFQRHIGILPSRFRKSLVHNAQSMKD